MLPEGRIDDLIKAIQYCVEKQIDVVNLSLGSLGDPESVAQIQSVVEPFFARAKAMGVACIVAAGNSAGPVLFPGSSPSVLCVSAIGKSGEFPADSYHATLPLQPVSNDGLFFPRFSCLGPQVGVAGPGVAIVSSIPGNTFVAWDGTSMATPHITGLAALVLAHNPDFQDQFSTRNSLRVDRLFEILKQSARPLGLGDPARTGAGLPDAVAAMRGSSRSGPGPIELTAEQQAEIGRRISELVRGILAGLPQAVLGG
jgi:subtilisin